MQLIKTVSAGCGRVGGDFFETLFSEWDNDYASATRRNVLGN